ncbi:tetratricopeptide repeat protein [Actinosynnema sp. CA-299493]
MEQDQVVKVHGARFGSGYLIAPRLVLTSSHLLAPGADVAVSAPASAGGRFAAAVRWDGGAALDAALVEITDAGWSPPKTLRGHLSRRVQRWGRCVTAGSPVPVAAMGFPRQQRQDDGRAPEELAGTVRPRGYGVLEVLDAHSPFGQDGGTGTPWSGMSGSAVFLDGADLLLGVVKEDRRPRHGARLTAVPAEDLLARDDFRAVVRAATGVDPRLEPAELADLLEPAPPTEVHSPAMLLRADAEVVPFHGRDELLDDLERWCLADGPPSARVLTGPGGQGKTRLARQLMARLRERGWVTGAVRGEPGDVRALRAVQHPLLLVVDYAESRPELVRTLWGQTKRASHPVRLLPLARSLGTWTAKATGDLPEVKLHSLSPEPEDRDRVFRAAARGFARRLADGVGRPDVDWPGLADALAVTRPAAAAETALTVQMAALVALLRQAPGEDRRPLEAELLEEHERVYWLDTAERRRIGEMDPGLLEQAVATAVLCPAADEDEAFRTIARVMPHEPTWLVWEVAGWLRDLYPPAEGHYWGGLQPDRLGEYHASRQVLRHSGLLTRHFAEAPDHQRSQTLTVLARAAVAHANERRADDAREVIGQLRAVLRAVPDHAPLTAAVLRAHSDTLPAQSHVLRDYALDVARELSGLCRATGDDPPALRDRARASHNLAERHLAVGGWTDAVTAAGEAAAIRERLSGDGDSPAYRTEWAESLLVLSRALRATGRLTESYRTGERALGLFRELAAEGAEEAGKRERGLVRALIGQAGVVWQLDPGTIGFDQVARSDEYTDEAVRRARDLVERDPDLDPLLLTDALEQRGSNFWRFRQLPTGLSPSEEAVATARRLAGENQDAYSGDLANALLGLAVEISTASPGEGMALEQEAIDLVRPLAADLPEVHLAVLGTLLHNLAWDRFDRGEHEAARDAVEEAIEHRRRLSTDPNGLEVPRLASSTYTLAFFEADAGDHQAAVEHFTETLALYSRAEVPLSATYLRSQSATALALAQSYAALGRTAEALKAVSLGGTIRRRLHEYAPSLYSEGYADALRDLADLYRRQGRRIPERIVLRHALPIYRRLARADAAGRVKLAYCLHDLGISYAAAWSTADRAVTALREAHDLLDGLPDRDAADDEYLAAICADLAQALLKTSRFADAVRVAEQRVRLLRHLSATTSDGRESSLYFALLQLARGLTMAGDPDAAWRTALDAEEIGLALVDRPDRTPAEVALLLGWLARTLSLCGRHDVRRAARAVEPARRAARLYRRLVDQDPREHQPDLRWAVDTLVTALTRIGRHAEAADVRLRRGA